METPTASRSDRQASSGGSACASRPSQSLCPAINISDSERMVSTVAGGLVLLYGVSKLSLSSLVALIAGGALAYRGATGHCSVYEALDMSTSEEYGNSAQGAHQTHPAHGVSDVSLAATGESNPKASRPSR